MFSHEVMFVIFKTVKDNLGEAMKTLKKDSGGVPYFTSPLEVNSRMCHSDPSWGMRDLFS